MLVQLLDAFLGLFMPAGTKDYAVRLLMQQAVTKFSQSVVPSLPVVSWCYAVSRILRLQRQLGSQAPSLTEQLATLLSPDEHLNWWPAGA